ncbi:hypothetical protein DESC_910034 [Desulfosarcina cetonica]|nr:hypothetical protein DESC_910034 [Desulfosarcina cetonica]
MACPSSRTKGGHRIRGQRIFWQMRGESATLPPACVNADPTAAFIYWQSIIGNRSLGDVVMPRLLELC